MGVITPYLAYDAVIIIGLMFLTAYLFVTRKFRYWERRGIAEVPPTPFIGSFTDCFLMKVSPSGFMEQLYNRFKELPFVGFYIFDQPCLLVRDPELVKNVLVKDFNVFPDRYASASPGDRLGYANLFMIKNPAWKLLRSKLSPIFTSGKLKKMFELMREVGGDLDEYLSSLKLDGDGQIMEFKDLSANFMTDLFTNILYGFKVNSLIQPETEFRKYSRMVFTFDFFRSLELMMIFFKPTVAQLLGFKLFGKPPTKYLRSIFWTEMNERERNGVKRHDFIDLLLELKKQYKDDDEIRDFQFDGDDLVAQAVSFLSAGFETSSSAMCFTLYELALHPEIQSNLRREIVTALEGTNGKVTYEMITTLPYLDMVVSETLRKYPPLGFLERIAVADYKLPNTDTILEKGTPVYISMVGMHYDPKYFPDPEKFDPERFSEENKRNRPSCVYCPFGEGPRICIGLRIGLIQAKLGVIQVLKDYELVLCEKTQIPMKLDPKAMTTTPLGGLHLKIRKINIAAA